jgi:hypothetical protein
MNNWCPEIDINRKMPYISSEQSKREGEAPYGFAGGGGDASPYK